MLKKVRRLMRQHPEEEEQDPEAAPLLGPEDAAEAAGRAGRGDSSATRRSSDASSSLMAPDPASCCEPGSRAPASAYGRPGINQSPVAFAWAAGYPSLHHYCLLNDLIAVDMSVRVGYADFVFLPRADFPDLSDVFGLIFGSLDKEEECNLYKRVVFEFKFLYDMTRICWANVHRDAILEGVRERGRSFNTRPGAYYPAYKFMSADENTITDAGSLGKSNAVSFNDDALGLCSWAKLPQP
jgi:hypothetical protein